MATFLSDYTLLDEIGRGAFASVYKVKHNHLGYIRAVRVLNETIAMGENDPLWIKFLAECRLLLRLGNGNNPHIVHIYQPLLRDNKAVVEMDYIDGMNLHNYLERNNRWIEAREVVRLAREMAEALFYCHHDIFRSCMTRDEDHLQDDPDDGSRVLIDDETEARLVKKYQIIHNDLHSGNIMRRENGSFVLLDFGLSIQDGDVQRSSMMRGGAPEYKAPEKHNSEGIITPQTDIFSMGVILYEMLTGHVPFPLNTSNPNSIEAAFHLSRDIQEKPTPSIYEARKENFELTHPDQEYIKDYPTWLETLIMHCLEKRPEMRFASGKEMYNFVVNNEKNAAGDTLDTPGIDAPQSLIDSLHAEIDGLKHIIQSLRNDKSSLQQQLDAKDSDMKHLQAEITELKTHINTHLKKVNRHNSDKHKLIEERNELREKVELLQQNRNKASRELNDCNRKIHELEQEVAHLRRGLVPTEHTPTVQNEPTPSSGVPMIVAAALGIWALIATILALL